MNKTSLDTNLKKLKKNAFRVSKVRGETASRVRCPGGEIDVDSLQRVVDIARKYGKGMVNITNRQGFEIPGIDLTDVEEVNKARLVRANSSARSPTMIQRNSRRR